MFLVGMPQENERESRPDHVLAPMMQGRSVEEDPEGTDPLLVAARWTLQGSEPPEDED